MTPLRNTRHETFARGLAEGKSISEAYKAAGYKSSRPHASRLATNGNIKGRVAELQDAAATETEITIRSLIEEVSRFSTCETKLMA